jgi:hypothetical protein
MQAVTGFVGSLRHQTHTLRGPSHRWTRLCAV